MAITVSRPWLVQRCTLEGDRLRYQYMGSSEFEDGDQARALKQIFTAGIALGETTVDVEGREVPVYMVAIDEFPFADYQPHLQAITEGLRMQEQTGFDQEARVAAADSLWTSESTERRTSGSTSPTRFSGP